MRRLWLVLAFGLSISGCAALSEAQKDMVICAKDKVCAEEAKDRASMWASVAGTVNPIAGPAVGALALSIGYLIGGRKKKKEI